MFFRDIFLNRKLKQKINWKLNFFGVLLLLLINPNCFAGTVIVHKNSDETVVDPMKQTQDLLKDSNQRQEVINSSQKAKLADDYGTTVVGKQNKEELYAVSSDLVPWLMEKSGGDPAKAMEMLNQAQQNPEAFYNSFPESERKKIRELASKSPQPRSTKP